MTDVWKLALAAFGCGATFGLMARAAARRAFADGRERGAEL